jgi:mRNA interferase YafQ
MKIITTKQFLKDLKKQKNRSKDLSKLRTIIKKLSVNEKLSELYREHRLKGEFNDFWECHIEPDWLLIYKKTKKSLYLARTGTHSDLF